MTQPSMSCEQVREGGQGAGLGDDEEGGWAADQTETSTGADTGLELSASWS